MININAIYRSTILRMSIYDYRKTNSLSECLKSITLDNYDTSFDKESIDNNIIERRHNL